MPLYKEMILMKTDLEYITTTLTILVAIHQSLGQIQRPKATQGLGQRDIAKNIIQGAVGTTPCLKYKYTFRIAWCTHVMQYNDNA